MWKACITVTVKLQVCHHSRQNLFSQMNVSNQISTLLPVPVSFFWELRVLMSSLLFDGEVVRFQTSFLLKSFSLAPSGIQPGVTLATVEAAPV